MRAVIQRVEQASVTVEQSQVSRIARGLLVLLAIEGSDGEEDLAFLKRRIVNLRIFEDSSGKMNLSLPEVNGQILLVPQFTLYGDCRKGNRPSYSRAAPPQAAQRFYERMIQELRREGMRVEAGIFQAMMKVSLVNDGPVTLIVDSRKDLY